MNPNSAQILTSQANAQMAINRLRDFVRDRFPMGGTADFRARANVNINASWTGSAVNFFRAGNGSDGMGEGNADAFAMYVYDDPVAGRGFSGGGGAVRSGLNTRQYSGDGNGGCYNGVHANGEVWMGAAWKVRANLNSSLDDVDRDLNNGTPNFAEANRPGSHWTYSACRRVGSGCSSLAMAR